MFNIKSFDFLNPNPKLNRKSIQILDGTWDFHFDPKNRGEKELIFKSYDYDMKINVPYSYMSNLSGIKERKRCDHVWYHRTIEIDSLNKSYMFHIDGADYITTLYVNGIEVKKFKGAYHRLSADITDYLKMGTNDITIKCDDSFSLLQPRGKQRFRKKNFACWYEETTGIYKTVWLEIMPKSHIHSIDIIPSYDRKSIDVTAISNKLIKDFTLVISYKDNVVFEDKNVKTNSFIYKKTIYLGDEFHPWEVLNPELYDVKAILKDEGEEDEVLSYFGFKKVEAKEGKIFLNDKEIYLKMCLDQGYSKDGGLTQRIEDRIKDIDNMIDLGFNGARCHQNIEQDRYYAYSDMMGFLTWCEMPSMFLQTRKSMANFEYEYTEVINEHKSYTSVMTYVPFNESWGIWGINKNRKKAATFVDSIVELTRKLDPSKLVISNDGWCHLDSDIYTIHLYDQTSEGLRNHIDDAINNNHIATLGKKKLTNRERKPGVPYMLDEFGGTAFQRNDIDTWGYGSNVSSTEEYEKRLSDLFSTVLDDKRLIGYCYTQLYDVRQEINGLYTSDFDLKIEKETLRKIQNNER